MRKCFLHIGRHKTGTTAIQWTLDQCRNELARHGYLYPVTGMPAPARGHHNIAWELAKLPYHQPRFGTVDELIAEIDASPHHVIISSEDFAISIRSFSDFRAFIRRLKDCGLAVTIVCYVRSPHASLKSTFVNILHSGLPFGFCHFIAAVLDDEAMQWNHRSAGGRDTLVENLIRLLDSGEANAIVRSYDDVSQAAVADFFSILGLNFAEFSDDEPRRNEAGTTAEALALFFRNVLGRDPDHREQALIAGIGAIAPMPTLHMSEPAWRLIAQKYQPELEILASRFGVRLVNPPSDPKRMPGHPCLEELFSVTMVRSIEAAARLLAETADAQDRAYKNVVAHYQAAIADRDSLVIERSALAAERAALVTQRDRAYEEVVAHYRAAIGVRDSLVIERDAIAADRDRAYNEVVAHYKAAIGARDRLNVLHEELSLTLDTVLKSRSWRMTAPLRNILARFAKRGR